MMAASDLFREIGKRDLFGEKTEKRNCLPLILKFLRSNIPRKIYSDPEPNRQFFELWQTVGKTFEAKERIHGAKAIFESLYHEITAAQIEEECYIPKGMPLVWMRDYCFNNLNQPWLAQRYILLTIIEDAIANKGHINPNTVGSYWRAVWFHNIEDAVFRKMAKNAYRLFNNDKDMGRFPEWILLNLMDDFSVKYPSNQEIEISPLNEPFAEHWFGRICSEKKKKGAHFEDFCAYLMSCMPGFEVQRRVQTGDYHFDALIRNKSNATDYRSDFGIYIITESKNWSDPIGPQEISYFASKMLFHDIRTGIIFSQKGNTGKGENRNAALTLLKSFYKVGRIIIILTEADIRKVIAARNLVGLLQSKYEAARFTFAI